MDRVSLVSDTILRHRFIADLKHTRVIVNSKAKENMVTDPVPSVRVLGEGFRGEPVTLQAHPRRAIIADLCAIRTDEGIAQCDLAIGFDLDSDEDAILLSETFIAVDIIRELASPYAGS